MQFNWEEFMDKTNKIAVHCKTEEEAIDFCKKMDEHGMLWHSGNSYIEKNEWGGYGYKEETCYSNNGYFADKNFYKENGYKVLEWSDYMMLKHPIDYLKYGYVVEFENGELGMYMPSQEGDCFDLKGDICCRYLQVYENIKELKIKDFYKDYRDVVKIYGYSRFGSNSRKILIEGRPLIWKRPEEVKKMTVSEICKELGYKVEIIAED